MHAHFHNVGNNKKNTRILNVLSYFVPQWTELYYYYYYYISSCDFFCCESRLYWIKQWLQSEWQNSLTCFFEDFNCLSWSSLINIVRGHYVTQVWNWSTDKDWDEIRLFCHKYCSQGQYELLCPDSEMCLSSRIKLDY